MILSSCSKILDQNDKDILLESINNFDELEPNSLIDLRVRLFLYHFLRKNCLKILNKSAYVIDFSQSIY